MSLSLVSCNGWKLDWSWQSLGVAMRLFVIKQMDQFVWVNPLDAAIALVDPVRERTRFWQHGMIHIDCGWTGEML
jgi:hypothetical protein